MNALGSHIQAKAAIPSGPARRHSVVTYVAATFICATLIVSSSVSAQTSHSRCTFDPGATTPSCVAVTPDGTELWVGSGTGVVTVVRLSDHAVVATIPVGYGALEIAISPDGAYAIVTNTVNGFNSTWIATATRTVVCNISGGVDPSGVVFTPDGDTALIVAHWSGILQGVSKGACAADYTIGGLGNGCYDVVVTPDGRFAYAAGRATGPNPGPYVTYKVDLPARAVVGTVPTTGEGIDITPDGSFILACGTNTANPSDHYVRVVATATDAVVDSVFIGGFPNKVRISPDGLYAYVTMQNDSSMAVLSIADRAVIAVLPVGHKPNGVTVSPDGLHIFVANYDSDCITEITTSCVWIPAAPPCMDRKSDLNCDAVEDVFDVIYLIDYVFGGGPQRVACPQE